MLLAQMDSNNFQLLEYEGDIEGEICAICKLELRSEQTIVQCPFCEYLFHKDHLIKWLQNNKDCPVCDNLIPYAISESGSYYKITDEESLTYLDTLRTLHNPLFRLRSSYNAFRVISFLLGLPLVVILLYLFISSVILGEIQGSDILPISLFNSFFVLIGFAMMIIPNLKKFVSRYNWKSLEFTKDGILIMEKSSSRVIKINPNDSFIIELEQYLDGKSSRYNQDERRVISVAKFHITLQNNLTKKKRYYFRSLCQFGNPQELHLFYRTFRKMLKQLYNIEVLTPTKRR